MTKAENELCGFLHADGCAMIVCQKRNRKYRGKDGDKVYSFVNYIPRVNITQRGDNLPFLEWVRDKYGGHVTENKSADRVQKVFQWTVQDNDTCLKLATLMADIDLPTVKRGASAVLRDFCQFKKNHSGKYSKEETEKLHEWYRQIRFLNSGHKVTE